MIACPSGAETAPPLVAAILGDRALEPLLARIVAGQIEAGRRVSGCLMRRAPLEAGGGATMVLVDIRTSEEYVVAQPLGANSKACRADPQGFARASQVFRTALDEGSDLVVSNRFGDLEVRGGGFCAELLELMSAQIPLLTTVSQKNVQAWKDFTGGAALLPADENAVEAWIRRAIRQRQASARVDVA